MATILPQGAAQLWLRPSRSGHNRTLAGARFQVSFPAKFRVGAGGVRNHDDVRSFSRADR